MRDALRTKYGLGAFLRRLRQPEDPEAQGLLQARRAAFFWLVFGLRWVLLNYM